MSIIAMANVIDLARVHLNNNEMQHALRTAKNVLDTAIFYDLSKEEFHLEIYTTVLLYHILDKVNMTFGAIDELFNGNDEVGLDVAQALNLLAKGKDENEEEYLKRIAESKNRIAIIVTRADLKDHLIQEGSGLTNENKENYINLMRYLI